VLIDVACSPEIDYNDVMKEILVISLYDGNNEIDEVDEEEWKQIKESCERCKKGSRVIWMGEEFMYMEL